MMIWDLIQWHKTTVYINAHQLKDSPPIYVDLYVDNLIYYSKSNKVKEWFENSHKSHVKVDFMGDVLWFLG